MVGTTPDHDGRDVVAYHLAMAVLSTLIHASRDLERFLLDSRDELGLGTPHQAYAAVLAVLVIVRR